MQGNFKKLVIEQSLNDIKVDLDEEFDRNFERKGFFDEKKWPERKYDDGVGSLMQRSGSLRRSIRSNRRGLTLVYNTNKPYGRIHNEGGEIKVTKKMKGYFWHKLKETRGSYSYKKNGEKRGNAKNRRLSESEAFYLGMATKKVGSTIKIPERRFIGTGKMTDKIIRDVVDENVMTYFKNNPIIEKK